MEFGFRHFAEKRPDFVALVDPQGNGWSRGELSALVNRLTRALLDAGLRKDDTIAIIAPNCAEYLAAHLAAAQAGLWIVPVNWHLAEEEIAFLLEDSAARAVIVHQAVGPRVLAAVTENRARADLLVSVGAVSGCIPLHELVAACSAEPVGEPRFGRLLGYTSATTGRPKAVRRSGLDGWGALEHIVKANAAAGIFPEDDNVHLCASMLYHAAPLAGVEVALHVGHRVILTAGRWQSELLLQLIDRYRVTTTFMVPAMFVRLLKLPASVRERYSTASLRFVVHGSAPCPHDVKRQMIEWWGDVVWEVYGATEVQGTIASAAEWRERPGTVGRPMHGLAVKIMDEDGRELPPFEVGLIYVLPRVGERVEYKGDPEKTRGIHRGDYVTAGDLGYVDEQGYLFICGRSSEVIISSGMNIYPAEIETVLAQHPLVRDCAVLGEPHAVLGEVPKAFVELEPGTERGGLLTAELLQFVGKRLSAMKSPKRIEYVETIPRDPNGKLYKRLLRERDRRGDARGC